MKWLLVLFVILTAVPMHGRKYVPDRKPQVTCTQIYLPGSNKYHISCTDGTSYLVDAPLTTVPRR